MVDYQRTLAREIEARLEAKCDALADLFAMDERGQWEDIIFAYKLSPSLPPYYAISWVDLFKKKQTLRILVLVTVLSHLNIFATDSSSISQNSSARLP